MFLLFYYIEKRRKAQPENGKSCRTHASCRGGDSRARRCTGVINRLSAKRRTPKVCHCEEAVGRILEVNPEHPLLQRLSESREADPERAKKLAELLYDQGLLMANLPLEDPTAYTDLVCELIG